MTEMDENGYGYLTEEKLRSKYGYIPKKRKSFQEKLRRRVQCKPSAPCLKRKITRFVPILRWLPRYNLKNYIIGDVISGLTTSIVRIPQGLAYGLLAGLEPINGLYTGFFSPLVYAFFGTSRHISVGVFSIVSLMLGSALDKQNVDTTLPSADSINTSMSLESNSSINVTETIGTDLIKSQNLAMICSLTVLIGLILLLLGVCRLGIVAMFLSDPLVSAFTTAAAIYVVTAQLKHVTGIPLKRKSGPLGLVKTYIELFSMLGEIQWAAVILSLICLLILVPLKYVNRTYKEKLRNIPIPVELFVVVVGTAVSGAADLADNYNVTTVGFIPSGMPPPILPKPSLWPQLIGDAISIAVVIFAVAVSMGKIFAKKHGYKIDPNQELVALGLCQITCGFFRGHAGGGALARSSVQESSGGNTQLAAFFSCLVVLLVLLVIGPLFGNLPIACLACIILSNLHGLLTQFRVLPGLWKLDVYDFSIWVFTFTAVILLGIDLGLGAGVVYSLCCGGIRASRAKITILGEIDSTGYCRDIKFYDSATEVPGIKIVHFSQSPTYANKSLLQQITPDMILYEASNNAKSALKKCDEMDNLNDNVQIDCTRPAITHSRVQIMILDCSSWSIIDTVGMSTLKSVLIDLTVANIKVFLASVQHDVYEKLKLCDIITADAESSLVTVYPSVPDAFEVAKLMLPNILENHSTSSDM